MLALPLPVPVPLAGERTFIWVENNRLQSSPASKLCRRSFVDALFCILAFFWILRFCVLL